MPFTNPMIDPNMIAAMLGGKLDGLMTDPRYDATLTLKNPANLAVRPTSDFMNPKISEVAGPGALPKQNQGLSPNTLGLINLAAMLGQALLGTPQQGFVPNSLSGVAGAAANIAQNALAQRYFQSLLAGGNAGNNGQALPFQ